MVYSRLFVTFFCFVAFAAGCKGPKTITTAPVNYASLYNPTATSLHPVIDVFHTSDSLSEVTIKVFPDQLLFNKANVEGIMAARVNVSLMLYELAGTSIEKTLSDSIVQDVKIEQGEIDKRYYINLPVKALYGKEYALYADIRDVNRNTLAKRFLYVDKRDKCNEQNFSIVYKRNNHMVFGPKSIGNEAVYIKYNNPGLDTIYIKRYSSHRTMPAPAFSAVYEPGFYGQYDTMWAEPYKGYLLFEAGNEGLYLFQADTTLAKGLALMRFYDGYPKIDSPETMAHCIVYLDNSPKYTEILNSNNIKLAIDNFWLALGAQNTERARQLIRIYYNRVFFANYYFTSYKEGWMTDRGMIFIVYGQPASINKQGKTETWVYQRKNTDNKTMFTFTISDNPYSNNHYVLVRDGSNTYWREAMTSWRRGRVFSFDDVK